MVGAGGIGGVVAAGLADAGCSVQVVDTDESHVRAIRAHGLRVSGLVDDVIRIVASTPDDAPTSLLQVVLAVKAHHVDAALDFVSPRLRPDGFVLTLSNGLAAVQVASEVGSARTLVGQASFGAQLLGPGHVVMGARGSVLLGGYDGGTSPRTQRVAEDFRSALGTATVVSDAMGLAWSKFVLVIIYIGTALDGRPMADVFGDAKSRPTLSVLAGAVVELAHNAGIVLRPIDDVNVESLADPRAAAWRTLQHEAEVARARRPRGGVYEDLVVHRRPTEVPAMLAAALAYAQPGSGPDRTIRALNARVAAAEREPSVLHPAFLRALLSDREVEHA